MRAPRIVLALALLLVAIVVYRAFVSAPDRTERRQYEEAASVNPSPGAAEPSGTVGNRAGQQEPVGPRDPDCMTREAFAEHPLVREAQQGMVALAPTGADIDAYRGVDPASVQSYADQGDSAAMVVIGATAVFRAFGLDPSNAIDWLNGAEPADGLWRNDQPLSAEAGLELNEAAYWFYQAALHGRLFALEYYGIVRGRLFGGAVGLGWISAEDFEALSPAGKAEYQPRLVYRRAVMDIAPQLETDLFEEEPNGAPEGGRLAGIRSGIAAEFKRTLEEAGMPPVRAAVESTELRELRSRRCSAAP